MLTALAVVMGMKRIGRGFCERCSTYRIPNFFDIAL